MEKEMRPRARELGIKIGILSTGERNSITDVPGVKVGQVSLISGHGKLVRGQGPVRTGVTAIIPVDGINIDKKLPAAVDVINGFGKSAGLMQIEELGEIETPILLTNTLNVGKVHAALTQWMTEKYPNIASVNAVVIECNDSSLNDIWGMHVEREHVYEAIAKAGVEVEEGCVGAGVGMRGFGFKAGIGTSSRLVESGSEKSVVGALVLTNTGNSGDLRIDGHPIPNVGANLRVRPSGQAPGPAPTGITGGSIIMVIATNAPLTGRNLQRLARRASFGLARIGGMAFHSSGDISLAFSTLDARYGDVGREKLRIANIERLNDLFRACVESTEEAILNSLLKAQTVEGRDGNISQAIPIDLVKAAVK